MQLPKCSVLYEATVCPSGVRQSMLETVVPKTENAAVMIVGGKKHKGQVLLLCMS